MIGKPVELPIVSLSIRVYQMLLLAYPAKFQQEYGSHMLQVFRDCCLRTIRQGGMRGLFMLWTLTLLDFMRSVFEQHLQKETDMSKSMFIKLSGWAFILGAFGFISILSVSLAGSVIGSILLAVGMLGLRARYGEIVGSFGKNVLLAGVVSMTLAYIAVPVFQEVEVLYILPFAGPAFLLTGLAVFGLIALGRKPLPHVNWLPLFAGIWYPVIYFPLFVSILMNNGAWPEGNFPVNLIGIMMSVQFLALCILGLILQSDVTEEAAVATA